MGGSGGGNNVPVPTSSYLSIDPAVRGQMDSVLGNLSQQSGQFGQNANNAAAHYQTNYNQYVPQLNTNFAQPNFSPNLDATSQNLVSQGLANIQAKTNAVQSQTGQQFQGQPGASNILQAQQGMQGALAGNQLPFQAMQQQQARQAQQFELGQNAQNLSNAALMQQGAAGAAGQSQTNAAGAQQLQMQNAGLAANQNLLSTLGGYAGLTGVSNSVPNTEGVNGNPHGAFASIMNPGTMFSNVSGHQLGGIAGGASNTMGSINNPFGISK